MTIDSRNMTFAKWRAIHNVLGARSADDRDDRGITLDRVLALIPDSLDREARTIIETYCALRIRRGSTTRELFEEHPVKASVEINCYVAGYDPGHLHRFEPNHVPSRVALFVSNALSTFYTALFNAGLRTAGDPFTALVDHRAVPPS